MASVSGSRRDDPTRAVRVRTPRGREVEILAVRRGLMLRRLADGLGHPVGLVMVAVLNGGIWLLSRFRSGWTVGVLSVDEEPWAGRRVLHRERCDDHDPAGRVADLKYRVETGDLPIPQPRNALLQRRP